MIGKITIGKSFRGCLLYCLNDKQKLHKDGVVFKNRAEILMFNKCFGNQNELIDQFNEVRQLTLAYELLWYGEHAVTNEIYKELFNEFEAIQQKLTTLKDS